MSARTLAVSRETGEIIRGTPPCHACRGVFCSIDAGFKFVQLTYCEQHLDTFKAHVVEHPDHHVMGFWFKRKRDGSGGGYCPFFNLVERKCGVYEERPATCRNFDCRACSPQGEFFKRNPDVRALIDQYETLKSTAKP